MTPEERRRLVKETIGFGDAALTIASSIAAEPLSGWWGILSGMDPNAVREAQDALQYMPRTEAGRRNLGRLAGGIEAAMDYQPPLSDQTLGEQFQAVGDYWRDRSVPALQDVFGEEVGAGLGATGIGILGAVGLPARASNTGRLAARLKAGEITPEQYRADMLRRGYITQEEAELMPKGREAGIASILADNSGMNPHNLAEAALAGWPKKGWYRNSATAIRDIFGDDAPRFAYLLSALSPQTSVESNLKNAVNVWSDWVQAGRPKDKNRILEIMGEAVEGDKGTESVLGAWRNNAYRALTADDPRKIKFSGPKVSSFARNLVGELGEVTNDSWMAKAMDVNQDIFSGQSSKAMGTDEFGKLAGQGAGYTAANAVTREAADILTRRLKEQGITVDPAEVQETVWSYAKALWERRAGEGNLQTMDELYRAGALSDDDILGVPDFGTLLHDNPYYHDRLAAAGANIKNVRPPVYDDFRPQPQAAGIRRFNTGLENTYRRSETPIELGRTIEGILNRTSRPFDDPGRLVAPRWMQGEKGRELRMDPYRQSRFESLGIPTPRLYQLDPGEGSGALFNRRMADVNERDRFGAAVDVYEPEKYGALDLYMTEGGQSGFALEGPNIVSLFKDPEAKDLRGITNYALPAAIQQGGRYLDAFDTVLPSLYSKAGFRPAGRVPFDEEVIAEYNPRWDYETFSKFNEGRPDVMTMLLDPQNADPLSVMTGPYAKRSKPWREKRQGILFDDYDEALEDLERQYQGILNSGRYLGY